MFRVVLKNETYGLSYCHSIMLPFNLGQYFLTLDLTRTKILLNLDIVRVVTRDIKMIFFSYFYFRAKITTLAHATSWLVARAHCVAAPITLFCVSSSHLLATVLAFSTRAAVLLATVLARPNNRSCLSLKYK